MPKRTATPPGDGNPTYFTICSPYPLNANWELKADQITFARWIASCIQKEYLIAILYKPTARGMVIIEVDRAFKDDDHRILLGEHRWNEFLKKPSEEEQSRCSSVFYCLYSDHRGAQKDGWKTINVRDEWFDPSQWSLLNPIIKYPYPSTHWCDLPPEDKTNKRICRPLPVTTFPPPPKAVRPVVGSSAWVQGTAAPSKSPSIQRAAWNNSASLSAVKTTQINRSSVIKPNNRSSAPSAVKPTPNAWGSQKGVAVLSPVSKGPASVPVISPQGAWASQKPAATPVSTKAWGSPKSFLSPSSHSPPALPTNFPSVPPGLMSDPLSSSSSRSPSSFDWAEEVEAEIASNERGANVDDLVDSTDDLAIAGNTGKMFEASDSDEENDLENHVASFADIPPNLAFPNVKYNVTKETVKHNLWNDVHSEPAEEEEEDECPVHGVLCSKGICQIANKMKAKKTKEKNSKRQRNRDRGRRQNSDENNARGQADNNSGENSDGSSSGKDRSPSPTTNSTSVGSGPVSRGDKAPDEPRDVDHNDLADPWDDF